MVASYESEEEYSCLRNSVLEKVFDLVDSLYSVFSSANTDKYNSGFYHSASAQTISDISLNTKENKDKDRKELDQFFIESHAKEHQEVSNLGIMNWQDESGIRTSSFRERMEKLYEYEEKKLGIKNKENNVPPFDEISIPEEKWTSKIYNDGMKRADSIVSLTK